MIRTRSSIPGPNRTDRRILALLQKNARQSNREIAGLVGIAESTCSTRIRRLETDGLISGYHATVEPTALGIRLQAMIEIQLIRHTSDAIDLFWSHATNLPEATGVFHLTGPNDFLVHLLLADADHLRTITSDVMTTWPEVGRVQTAVVFEHRVSPQLPTDTK